MDEFEEIGDVGERRQWENTNFAGCRPHSFGGGRREIKRSKRMMIVEVVEEECRIVRGRGRDHREVGLGEEKITLHQERGRQIMQGIEARARTKDITPIREGERRRGGGTGRVRQKIQSRKKGKRKAIHKEEAKTKNERKWDTRVREKEEEEHRESGGGGGGGGGGDDDGSGDV
ncbi:hypothetical protein Pcinc_012724 [Petrolisthes cinctipes]|uniref:Uncharacterized protein n=1 Tax=Petrolisthes cinctipes TaxID=88211 RepID=A0AAE1G446_PETCI|nr:hypothetical protein Pcinc_012724 [Petrolisthes cinctipes]